MASEGRPQLLLGLACTAVGQQLGFALFAAISLLLQEMPPEAMRKQIDEDLPVEVDPPAAVYPMDEDIVSILEARLHENTKRAARCIHDSIHKLASRTELSTFSGRQIVIKCVTLQIRTYTLRQAAACKQLPQALGWSIL